MYNIYTKNIKIIISCLYLFFLMNIDCICSIKYPIEVRNDLFKVYIDSAVGNEIEEVPLEDSKQTITISHFLNEELVFNILDTSLSFNSNNSLFLIDNLFEGLLSIERDKYKDFLNGLAESFTYDKDALSWTIKLKEGLKWSDGSKLTAHDFVRFIRAQFDPRFYKDNVIHPIYKNELLSNSNYKNASKVLNGELPIEELGVWTEGDNYLKLQYEKNDPINNLKSRFIFLYPLHISYLENFNYDEKIINLEKVISNGPFRIKKIEDDRCIILEKNPYYWDSENVFIKELKFLLFENELECLAAWQNGDVDVSHFSHFLVNWRNNLDIKNITSYPCNKFRCLYINNSKPPLNFKEMRKALYYFIGYEALHYDKSLKIGEKMFGFLDESFSKNYDIPPEFTKYSQLDFITGKRLIRSLKLKPRKKPVFLKLFFNPSEAVNTSILTLLQNVESVLKTSSIEAKRSEIYKNILDDSFETAIWSCYFLPDVYLRYRALFSVDKDHAYNFSRFHSDSYNEALMSIEKLDDQESILNLENIFYQEHPIVSLFMEKRYYIVSSDIGNWNGVYNNYSRNGDIYYKRLFKKHCTTL